MKREIKGNILVWEDKIQMQRLLISNFMRVGIDVIIAKSSDEMMEMAEDKSAAFDLIIIDIDEFSQNLAMNCCKKLRTKHNLQQLPIVFISAQPNPQTISSAFALGCNDFIAIPFNSNEFITKVQFLIEVKKTFEQKLWLKHLVDTRTQVFKMNTHDLKNPLSSIFSLSGIPVEAFTDNEEISQTLKVIHDASKIMMSLVNKNLEYITVSSDNIKFEKEAVDLILLLNQIIEINNPLAASKNQQIIFNYPEEDCVIISDSMKIYQAINNIISNAVKFSPRDKRIWLEVSKIKFEGEKKILVKIRDEGPGFKKEEVDNVFVKFGKHSATPTGDEISTGLGLLITKQIINAVKGKIYLKSEEGKGSEFTIVFNVDTVA